MVGDVPGMVVARTVAMLVNEAADAVAAGRGGRCRRGYRNKTGVSYPRGRLVTTATAHLLINAILVNAGTPAMTVTARASCYREKMVERWRFHLNPP